MYFRNFEVSVLGDFLKVGFAANKRYPVLAFNPPPSAQFLLAKDNGELEWVPMKDLKFSRVD